MENEFRYHFQVLKTCHDIFILNKKNKENNKENNENNKKIVNTLIDILRLLYTKNKSDKFFKTVVKLSKEKKEIKQHLNIRDLLISMYENNLMHMFSENSIQYYANGNIYDYIFLLDDITRFTILLFLYFGIVRENYVNINIYDSLKIAFNAIIESIKFNNLANF